MYVCMYVFICIYVCMCVIMYVLCLYVCIYTLMYAFIYLLLYNNAVVRASLRRLVAGVSPWRPGFDARLVSVGLEVET